MKCKGCKEMVMGCYLQTMGLVAISDCPCKDCLVKMICEIPCEEFNKFVGKTKGHIKKAKQKEIYATTRTTNSLGSLTNR